MAAVCRAKKRCGRCGKENCKEECKDLEKANCVHCGGEHHAGSAQCPRRVKEGKVNKIREKRGMSYAAALKKVEGSSREEVQQLEKEEHGDNISIDKRGFLAFIAMVINCAVDIQTKSERIKMVLDAARRFLRVEDVTGEDLDNKLREGFAPQTQNV